MICQVCSEHAGLKDRIRVGGGGGGARAAVLVIVGSNQNEMGAT